MPTVLRVHGYRFFFFSREGKEPAHVHVQHGSHYAKFWLSPVSLARTAGFRQSELGAIQRVLRENREYLEGRYHEHIRKLSSLD